ncbi:MAG TPA: UDP-4-amino-4,6-dideoxy-N-acetyl-beta-L-altrosamine transaminase [Candidatus Ozemobacteraceae bacterium]|nr:UDP-4-amino-4,6-dideoxy-N-acetyl-beta-L-altrosamine transaminase [Candidatus Ozemobacteraceae bacterium]
MVFIPYGKQDIDEADVRTVLETLRSDFLTQGPAIERFEKAFATEVGAPLAVACANGTAALHLCSLAGGVRPGDRAVVTPISFVASANCIRYAGGTVEFADIEPHSLTLSPARVAEKLEQATAAGNPIRVVVTVDLCGHPCDLVAFARLKKQYGFLWIHDACHALGASACDEQGRRRRVGEWPEIDYVAYSFHPVKHITTGEGGMVTTHDQAAAERLRQYRTHGITRQASEFVNRAEAYDENGTLNPWYYEMQALGYNFRLTDLQAALGESQLRRLPGFLLRRREIANRYRESLSGLRHLNMVPVRPDVEHAYHLFVVRIDYHALGKSRARVMTELRSRDIGTQVHYIPIPMMPAYGSQLERTDLPVAWQYYREALSIPCYAGMTDTDVDRVIQALKEVVT